MTDHQDHYAKPTREDLETLVKARAIVQSVADLDGDKDLQQCVATMTLLIDDIAPSF